MQAMLSKRVRCRQRNQAIRHFLAFASSSTLEPNSCSRTRHAPRDALPNAEREEYVVWLPMAEDSAPVVPLSAGRIRAGLHFDRL